MAFVDELKIYIEAGNGGDGVVRFLRTKFKPLGGPSGGNGGKGGDVYVRAVRDLGKLASYRHKKEFKAEDGGSGKKDSQEGKNGDDLFIDLPIGSVIHNTESGEVFNLETDGETIKILRGGRGGLGNEHFKSSTNQAPKEWTAGKEAERGIFFIELELIAEAGLIGLPSAGKSSLLNELTNAQSKVAEYHFTTLEPHLGNMEGYILADIPGIIEGAHEGKGLGHKFLRHIKRTKTLLHCISCENGDVLKTYNEVRSELEAYSHTLAVKEEIVILTKTDLLDEKELKAKRKMLEAKNPNILEVSILDDESVKNLKDTLVKIFREEK